MKDYKFTENWFRHNDIAPFLPTKDEGERHILEIGSFEGKSTVWFIDTLLSNPKSTITCIDPWTSYSQDADSFASYNTPEAKWHFGGHKENFLYNIKETGNEGKVIIEQGYSHEVVPRLITEGKQYDIIFIDGNHVAPFVLADAVFSWYCLKPQGIMIFDDYTWGQEQSNRSQTLSPKLAVDSFINTFSDYCEVIHKGYRKAIKKTK